MTRFAGYAAVFDAPDRGGDVIRKGAFGGVRVRRVPLLWQHRGAPVGVIEAIGEDARGLRVTGRVDAPELAGLVAKGAVTGLSFGYRVRDARHGRWRELNAVELCEVSLVARPMQALARVHACCAVNADAAAETDGGVSPGVGFPVHADR